MGGKTEKGHNFKCEAVLEKEARNRADPNAVCIRVSGRIVGYLSRRSAIEFRHAIRESKARCDAKVCGGWKGNSGDEGHFGIKLNVKWPPSIE